MGTIVMNIARLTSILGWYLGKDSVVGLLLICFGLALFIQDIYYLYQAYRAPVEQEP
jgi:hypothetical protein